MKKAIDIIGKTVKFIFIVFCVYLISLFFHQQQLPRSVIDSLCRRFSDESFVLHCDSASIGFRYGLHLGGVHVYDPTRECALSPILSADSVSIGFFTKTIEISSLRYERLGDAYYQPGLMEAHAPDFLDGVTLPKLDSFRLVLDHPSVLGIEPRRLEATVSCDGRRLELASIKLLWPDEEMDMSLDGLLVVDLDRHLVDGFVRGTASQAFIRPLLVTLEIEDAYPYIDAFTGISRPVKSYCAWKADLLDYSLHLELELDPPMGLYNGVPLKSASGRISFDREVVDGKENFVLGIGPIHATDRQRGRLDGVMSVSRTNGVLRLDFDAASSLAKEDILDIVGYFNDGTLDGAHCGRAPVVSVSGELYPKRLAESDLRGRMACEDFTVFELPFAEIAGDYRYHDDRLVFDNLRGVVAKGGIITGEAGFVFPPAAAEPEFFLDLQSRDGYIRDLAYVMDMKVGENRGRVDTDLKLSGPLSTNAVSKLSGSGRFDIKDGHLAQMKLFAGLTEMLAEYVPGVAAIVNQSNAHGTFSITNGVFSTKDAVIDGSTLLAIYLDGNYDLAGDNLDFVVKARFLKDDSALGRYLIRPVLWPFSKLLMEFRLTGPIDNPKWENITILDRIK